MAKLHFYLLAVLFALFPASLFADVSETADDVVDPTVTPVMIYTDEDGMEVSSETSFSGGAPFVARFEVTLEDIGDYTPLFEWRFTKDGYDEPFLIRYDQNTEYTFKESGTFYIELIVSLVQGRDTLEYEMDDPFVVNIAESKLEVPNAFTPNGDSTNDVFKVKEGYESLVEFHAVVFNRWGKKIYEWNDPADGWDGTMNGHGGTPAPVGAYYLILNAKGADGLKYNYKKTINLLRDYNETASGSGE